MASKSLVPATTNALALPGLLEEVDRLQLTVCPTAGCGQPIEYWACYFGVCVACCHRIRWPDYLFFMELMSYPPETKPTWVERRAQGWMQVSNELQAFARLAFVSHLRGETDAAPLHFGIHSFPKRPRKSGWPTVGAARALAMHCYYRRRGRLRLLHTAALWDI